MQRHWHYDVVMAFCCVFPPMTASAKACSPNVIYFPHSLSQLKHFDITNKWWCLIFQMAARFPENNAPGNLLNTKRVSSFSFALNLSVIYQSITKDRIMQCFVEEVTSYLEEKCMLWCLLYASEVTASLFPGQNNHLSQLSRLLLIQKSFIYFLTEGILACMFWQKISRNCSTEVNLRETDLIIKYFFPLLGHKSL